MRESLLGSALRLYNHSLTVVAPFRGRATTVRQGLYQGVNGTFA